jgi:hypothetical protein
MKPSQMAQKLRQIASAIDNSKNPRRDLVAADLRRIVAVIDDGEYEVDPEVCTHPRSKEIQKGDKLICGRCGKVQATGMPTKGRSFKDRDSDDAQTKWEN